MCVRKGKIRGARLYSSPVVLWLQGVIAFWGLAEKQERDVIRNIVTPCLIDPLPQVIASFQRTWWRCTFPAWYPSRSLCSVLHQAGLRVQF